MSEIADVEVFEITVVRHLKKYDDGHHFAHRALLNKSVN